MTLTFNAPLQSPLRLAAIVPYGSGLADRVGRQSGHELAFEVDATVPFRRPLRLADLPLAKRKVQDRLACRLRSQSWGVAINGPQVTEARVAPR